jgi:hypothetical protein
VSRAAAQAPTFYQGTYHGRPDQVSRVRAAVAWHLGDCPAADDAVLIVSELAGNAVLHSASAGDFFTVRCELFPAYVWIVEALTGPDNWGVETTSDGDRVVWVRLDLAADA